jgi:tetratricopeptide (TPR) repeat protein
MLSCAVAMVLAVAQAADASSASARIAGLQRAASLLEQHQTKEAEAALQSLLDGQPDDPLALNLLGLVRVRQQNKAEAESLFRQAIATGHPLAGPHINLAALYGSEQPIDALSELAEALKISPDNQQARTLVGILAKDSALNSIRAGRWEDARSVLTRARQILPSDPGLQYQYGLLALQMGRHKEAREALEQALFVQPDFPDAIYALARADLAGNRAQEAEQWMRRYVSARPDDASAQYGLGYILVAEQKLDDAKAAFDRSLALRPAQTESLFQLGEIAMQQGRSDAARARFSQVLSRDPDHAGALTETAVLAYREAKYQEAKTNLERAIARSPDYQKAHYYYALTLSKLGNKQAAEREFAASRLLQEHHAIELSLP